VLGEAAEKGEQTLENWTGWRAIVRFDQPEEFGQEAVERALNIRSAPVQADT